MIFYLSGGCPAKAIKIKSTSEELVNDYYYQNRVSDLNKLIDHIAYLKHLETENN